MRVRSSDTFENAIERLDALAILLDGKMPLARRVERISPMNANDLSSTVAARRQQIVRSLKIVSRTSAGISSKAQRAR
jgi:hypothetical protein